MLAAHNRLGGVEEPVAIPDDSVDEHEICALSGEIANAWCPVRRREWLHPGADHRPCSWHHLGDRGVIVVWPAIYREWARKQGGATATAFRLKPEATREGGVASGFSRKDTAAGRPTFHIANPPGGATYMIDPTLRREFQTLPLRVVAPTPGAIAWTINGDPLATVSSESVVEWPLRVGRHRITARDEQGRTAESVVVVR